MFRTVPIKVNLTREEKAYWIEQCKASNSLYNSALYEYRQQHYQQLEGKNAYSTYWRGDELRCGWQTRKVTATSYNQLDKLLKPTESYKILAAQAAQQTLKSVQEAISSYNAVVDSFFKGEVERPSIPRYRKSGGLNTVTFPAQALRYKQGFVYPSLSKLSKPDLLCEIKLELPDFIDFDWVRQVRIRPSRGEFWVDWVIDDGTEPLENNPNLNYNQILAIDHGVKFWLSAVTTKGRSFIVNAPELKTGLFKYRDQVTEYKKNKPDKYWDDYLHQLTAKRNLQVTDAVNKAARFIINRCLKDRIGNLVIGWNKGNKTGINIGKQNNYQTVSMPTARLIQRLKQLCEEYGVKFYVISEEYTSKASFLDRDQLHQLGEKPLTWKPSGKRITRDQYRSQSGVVVHADINAAANILRKVIPQIGLARTQIGLFLKRIDGVMTDPKRYDLFRDMKKKYRKQMSRSAVSTRSVTTA
ncbi:MAG: transposase [Calothrix sp. MO_192.B10]|nr:transposase [Calothrix sp. MO_192.B10]